MERKRKFREGRYYGFFTKMGDEELLNYCFSLYGEDVGRTELRRKNKGLYNIIKNKGLLDKIKKQRKPVGHWKDFENVKSELQRIIEETGKFPTTGELEKRRLSGMLSAILEYHGGLNAVREKMGFKIIKRANGYYKPWKVFKRDMKKVIKENKGELPSDRKLREMRYTSLSKAIYKYHGGMLKLRKKMGCDMVRMPNKYYKDWKNVKAELKKIIKQNNGKFPLCSKLNKTHRGLDNAITDYFGGYNAVRKKLGYPEKREIGYYKKWANVKKKLKEIIKKNKGEFPSSTYLSKNFRGLDNAINNYFGGYRAVRKKMGFEQVRKPNGYYKPWKVFEKDMNKAIKENDGEFPTRERLKEMEYSSLDNAITKYHGGIAAVREKIGYNEQIRIKLAKKLEEVVERMVG